MAVGWGVGVSSPRPLVVGQLSGVLPRVGAGQVPGVAVAAVRVVAFARPVAVAVAVVAVVVAVAVVVVAVFVVRPAATAPGRSRPPAAAAVVRPAAAAPGRSRPNPSLHIRRRLDPQRIIPRALCAEQGFPLRAVSLDEGFGLRQLAALRRFLIDDSLLIVSTMVSKESPPSGLGRSTSIMG